jgi:hypothetical protein
MSNRASRITSFFLLLATPTMLLAADKAAATQPLVDAPSAVALRTQATGSITAELPRPVRVAQAAAKPLPQATNAAGHRITVAQPKAGKVRAAMPQADGGNGRGWVWLAVGAVAGAVALGVWQATDDDDVEPEDND